MAARSLHDAAREGKEELVLALLAADGDDGGMIGRRDEDGRTPLHWAAAGGHADVMRALLQGGAERANIDNQDEAGWTALMSAARTSALRRPSSSA